MLDDKKEEKGIDKQRSFVHNNYDRKLTFPEVARDPKLEVLRNKLLTNVRVDDFGISYVYHKPINNWEQYLEKEIPKFNDRLKNRIFPLLKKSDFTFIKKIGEGGFGVVMLVLLNKIDTYLAAKIISKAVAVKLNHTIQCNRERDVLSAISFPFTLHLEFFLQDSLYVYFIMPFVIGGDLFALLQKFKRFNEEIAKFYIAQIVLCIEYLHNLNILYRDLKPENILIDHIGYLKLTDYGLCKYVTTRTYTLTGTPEYIPPEMIANKGYGKSVDWWETGVLIFELCAGYSPFADSDITVIMSKITEVIYKMPEHFSKDLRDLISKLLESDTTKRYGVMKDGVKDIKYHRWFNLIDWLSILNKRISAPYKPPISSPSDTRHFPNYTHEFI